MNYATTLAETFHTRFELNDVNIVSFCSHAISVVCFWITICSNLFVSVVLMLLALVDSTSFSTFSRLTPQVSIVVVFLMVLQELMERGVVVSLYSSVVE